MRVIFGADAIRPPLTGIGRYAVELATRLQVAEGMSSLRFLVGARLQNDIPAHEATGKKARAGGSRALSARVLRSTSAVAAYRALSSLAKRWALRNEDDSIFHGPNYYLPPHSGPCVSTFHDLSVFRYSECHPAERVRYMEKELPLAIQRSSAIICDSEYVKQELIDTFGLSAAQVTAIPLACGDEFRPRAVNEVQTTLKQYGLSPRQYALFVGTVEPRKNLAALLDAYSRLPLRLARQSPLVVAGYEGWGSEEMHARIMAAQHAGWARYLGYLPAHELPILFSGARVFAFPSLYEGFGLPVLEAMASGVPVICSNASSLPEVVGDAALMHEPGDVTALTEALHCALDDARWCARTAEAGICRAARFSWDRTASETLAVYRTLQ